MSDLNLREVPLTAVQLTLLSVGFDELKSGHDISEHLPTYALIFAVT